MNICWFPDLEQDPLISKIMKCPGTQEIVFKMCSYLACVSLHFLLLLQKVWEEPSVSRKWVAEGLRHIGKLWRSYRAHSPYQVWWGTWLWYPPQWARASQSDLDGKLVWEAARVVITSQYQWLSGYSQHELSVIQHILWNSKLQYSFSLWNSLEAFHKA